MKKKNLKNIFAIVLSLAVLTPVVSFALLTGTAGLLKSIGGLMNPIISIMVGLAIIYFFWGMGQFILHAGEPEAREEGRQKMIWGVVAIAVMVSIYGIVGFLGGIFGISTGNSSGNGGGNPPCALGDLNCGDGSGNGY